MHVRRCLRCKDACEDACEEMCEDACEETRCSRGVVGES